MRVLICGGRDYRDKKRLYDVLQDFEYSAGEKIETVINGGANGADQLARVWAKDKGVKLETYEADWDNDGPSAGPIRNQRMVDEGHPDVVIAFPGGKGTADMVRRAKSFNIDVVEIT